MKASRRPKPKVALRSGRRGRPVKAVRGRGRPSKAERHSGPPPKKERQITASDGSTWVVKRIGDQEVIIQKTHEATRKPRLKRADFVWNPFYRSFKKNKKPSS